MSNIIEDYKTQITGKGAKSRRRDGYKRPPSSPVYSFDTIKSTVKVGDPIPVIYGKHRVGGNIIQAYLRGSSSVNQEELFLLMALGWGELNKIDTFSSDSNGVNPASLRVNGEIRDDILCSLRLGDSDQTVLPNTATSVLVNNVDTELTQNNGIDTTTTNTPKFIEIGIEFEGLFGLNKNGSIPFSVDFSYSIARTDDAVVEDSGVFTVEAENAATFIYRKRSAELTGDVTYDVTITRTSADQSTQPTGYRSTSTLKTIDEIGSEEFTYPYVALLELTSLATDEFNGEIPNITIEVEGKKITTYDGSSTTVEYSNNPAWIVVDMLISKIYGLGRIYTIDDIDLDSFKTWADYCDETVDGETRHTFNGVFDDPNLSAYEAILLVCDLGRATLDLSGSKISINVTKSQSVNHLVTESNCNDIEVNYRSAIDKPDAVSLTYFDEDEDYAEEIVGVSVSSPFTSGAYTLLQVTRIGITNRKEAIREAEYILADQQASVRTISFVGSKTLLDVTRGDLIQVGYDPLGWAEASGLNQKDGTISGIYLDRAASITSGSTLMVRQLDGTIEQRVVSSSTGDYEAGDLIEVTVDFDTTPPRWCPFIIGTQVLFRVDVVQRQSDNSVKIEASEYIATVYDDVATVIPSVSYTNLPKAGLSPLNLLNIESLSITRDKSDGTRFTTLDVFWDYPAPSLSENPRAVQVEIYLRVSGGSFWEQVGTVNYPQVSFSILKKLIPGTSYDIAVVPVSIRGEKKSPSNTNVLLSQEFNGDTSIPDEVTDTEITDEGENVSISFTRLSDETSLQYYEVRKGNSWQLGEIVSRSLSIPVSTNKWVPGEDNHYHIRSRSLSNKYSTESNRVTISKDHIGTELDVRDEATSWSGTKTGVSIDGNDLRGEGTYETAQVTLPAHSNNVDIRVHIKAYIDDTAVTWDSATGDWSTSLDCWEGDIDQVSGSLNVELKYNGGSYASTRYLVNKAITTYQAKITTEELITNHEVVIEEFTIVATERS